MKRLALMVAGLVMMTGAIAGSGQTNMEHTQKNSTAVNTQHGTKGPRVVSKKQKSGNHQKSVVRKKDIK